ncbi:MAG: hypothetical protein RBT76_04460 [candidate division Zixibacteria bacterium]|jgi:hypothetical protein|nr:hypothetical protein [candidate division Zixibacteria bacterium]
MLLDMERSPQILPARLEFLYTNIGRGHPFYLDGIAEALIRRGQINLVRRERDVFEISRGVSQIAWRTARRLYRAGSSGGFAGFLYRRLRKDADYSRKGLLSYIMARDLRREYLSLAGPVIVAHPSLVGFLAGHPMLCYQHGELVAPAESQVVGAQIVFVPTEEVALSFLAAGYDRQSIVVTGLCIEPGLARQAVDAFAARVIRYGGLQPLTGAFFSSGAEPSQHVDTIADAALSGLRNGHRVIVFAKRGGKLARAALHAMQQSRRNFAVVDKSNVFQMELPSATIIEHSNRREENALTARLFPTLDYFVAPAHERSNWAVGLGLPMFIVEPCIGPYAPLNRDELLRLGVAAVIGGSEAAKTFGSRVNDLRASGQLETMAAACWRAFPIDGFDRIATFLIDRFSA